MTAPTWVWPEWRKAPVGLRVRHAKSGEQGTYLGASRNKHNGAKVRWDRAATYLRRREEYSYVVSPARDLEPISYSAWDLIGFDGSTEHVDFSLRGIDTNRYSTDYKPQPASVQIVGGRTLYEGVGYDTARGGENVRLSRLVADADGLREVVRYVPPDTPMEVVVDV